MKPVTLTFPELIGVGSAAPWTVAALGEAVAGLLPLFATGGRWWVQSGSAGRAPVYGAADLERPLLASRPSRPSELRRGAPAHELLLRFSRSNKEELGAHAASFAHGGSRPMFAFSLSPRGDVVHQGTALLGSAWLDALSFAVRVLRFDHAVVQAGSPQGTSKAARRPRVGWLTYLSRALGPLPVIPPPTTVIPVDDLGWILVAQPEPVDPRNPDHQASLAYVRHALGARVLLDGPAFPPPSREAPESPPHAGPTPSLVPPAQVPSYLRAGAPPEPPAPSKALSTETADIDLSKLLRGPIPFAPGAPAQPAPEAPKSPKSPPAALDTGTVGFDASEILKRSVPFESAQSSARFGGTEEFTLNSLLKTRPAVPFEKEPAPDKPPAPKPDKPSAPDKPPAPEGARPVTPPAATVTPAPPRGPGRWIRFNPQTGEPLAVPYWEDLPGREG